MMSLSGKAKARIAATGIPLWGFQFHAIGLSGPCRFGGDPLHVLYAGTAPFIEYFKRAVFRTAPSEEDIGTYNLLQLNQVRSESPWDLEVYRGHRLLARSGLFPSGYFVPEWVSGIADLISQSEIEKTSKSRRRDRALLRRNNISYTVTDRESDLSHFYEAMYLPHVRQKHGGSVFLMSREEMMSRVEACDGRLIVIWRGSEAVAGSLIVQEEGRPRLYSQGILDNNKELMRAGVGTAVYLSSFDHLLEAGYTDVHMGWTRAFLTDGSLYFKQRFGLQVRDASSIGHFLRYRNGSRAANAFLTNTGFIHGRRQSNRVALFCPFASSKEDRFLERKRAQSLSMGVSDIDVIKVDSRDSRPVRHGYHLKAGSTRRRV